MNTKFWSDDLKGRDQSEDLGVDGNNTKMDLTGTWWEVVDRIHQDQDRNQRRASVNTALNLRGP